MKDSKDKTVGDLLKQIKIRIEKKEPTTQIEKLFLQKSELDLDDLLEDIFDCSNSCDMIYLTTCLETEAIFENLNSPGKAVTETHLAGGSGEGGRSAASQRQVVSSRAACTGTSCDDAGC